MKTYVLEQSHFDTDEIILVTQDVEFLKSKINYFNSWDDEVFDEPYFYLSVWENNSCIKRYKGNEIDKIAESKIIL